MVLLAGILTVKCRYCVWLTVKIIVVKYLPYISARKNALVFIFYFRKYEFWSVCCCKTMSTFASTSISSITISSTTISSCVYQVTFVRQLDGFGFVWKFQRSACVFKAQFTITNYVTLFSINWFHLSLQNSISPRNSYPAEPRLTIVLLLVVQSFRHLVQGTAVTFVLCATFETD